MLSAPELERLITTRRDLHRHPELAYEERRTAGIVARRLTDAGYQVRTGVAVTGVVGTLGGGAGPGPTLLLRADMDALPIQEQAGHDYASTVPGTMHACGHDAHVAIGLAVAERLADQRERWGGEVRYVFQPAEEGHGGALRMIEAGVLEGVDAALGLHVWLWLPSGQVGVVEGPQMASSQEFRIRVRGRGGHAGQPDDAVDAIYLASQLIVALQGIVSRSISPLDGAVVSIGSLHAGTAPNVVAEDAVLEGTIRAFRAEVADRLRQRIEAVAGGVCGALDGACEVEFAGSSYPPTINDPRMTALVREAAAQVVGEERLVSGAEVRTMAAEDFGEFSARVPGCFFFVGARNEATGAVHPHHSPRFDLCESALPVAVAVLEGAALRYLRAAEDAGG